MELIILSTIFAASELFAVGFVVFKVFTDGGWWLVGLVSYVIILLYLGGPKKTFFSIATCVMLAISYEFGGIIASIVFFAVVLALGFMFPETRDP